MYHRRRPRVLRMLVSGDADLPCTHRRRPVRGAAQEVSGDADLPCTIAADPSGVLRKRSAGTLTFHTDHGAVGILRWGGRRLPLGRSASTPTHSLLVSGDADLPCTIAADPSGVLRKRSARTLTFHVPPRQPAQAVSKRSARTLTFHTDHGAVGILRWGGRHPLLGRSASTPTHSLLVSGDADLPNTHRRRPVRGCCARGQRGR